MVLIDSGASRQISVPRAYAPGPVLPSGSGAGVAQLAERQPSKLHVASSNLVSRSTRILDTSTRLRAALERTVVASERLVSDAAEISAAYRAVATAVPAIRDRPGAMAYAATRMPATFAAATRAMTAAADRNPSFAPGSLLDVGGGTGAVAWAARAVWPSIESIIVVDRQPATLDLGRQLAAASGDDVIASIDWRAGEAVATASADAADLVTCGYLLGELSPGDRATVVDRLRAASGGLVVVIEPGSRAGFERILAARSRLIGAGAHVVAPCPGPQPCPVAASTTTWCHFLARLDRSPLHRKAKQGSRSWEDEPFSYVAVAREPAEPAPRVVLGRPRRHPGRVELRICVDGRIETRVLSRREGETWRIARDLEWGDPAIGIGGGAPEP